MIKHFFVFIFMFFCITIAGCASSGNQALKKTNQTTVLASIKEGETTKDQVLALLGPATSISFTDSAKEIWTYMYSESTSHASNFIPYVNIFSSGQNVETKELVILFESDGKVLKRTMRETTSVQKRGIFGKS